MRNVLKNALLIFAFIVIIAFIAFVCFNSFLALVAMPVVLVVLGLLDGAVFFIASAGTRGRKLSLAATHAYTAVGLMVLLVIFGIGMLIRGGSSPKPADAFIPAIMLFGAVPDIAFTLAADYILWWLGQRTAANEDNITKEGEQ